MPALVAMRFNPDLKAKYQAMIKAGKPPKVALTALMRKLIELANTLIKADRNWVKNRLDQDGYSSSEITVSTKTCELAAPARQTNKELSNFLTAILMS